MSDALSDIAADSRRFQNYCSFLELLFNYLNQQEPDPELFSKLVRAAEQTDRVKNGFFSGQTNLIKNLEEKVARLREGDQEEWLKLLIETNYRNSFYEKLKEISPFAGRWLIVVDYCLGYRTVRGRLEEVFSEFISKAGWKTNEGDTFVVSLPKPETGQTDIFQLDSGGIGVIGPRKDS